MEFKLNLPSIGDIAIFFIIFGLFVFTLISLLIKLTDKISKSSKSLKNNYIPLGCLSFVILVALYFLIRIFLFT